MSSILKNAIDTDDITLVNELLDNQENGVNLIKIFSIEEGYIPLICYIAQYSTPEMLSSVMQREDLNCNYQLPYTSPHNEQIISGPLLLFAVHRSYHTLVKALLSSDKIDPNAIVIYRNPSNNNLTHQPMTFYALERGYKDFAKLLIASHNFDDTQTSVIEDDNLIYHEPLVQCCARIKNQDLVDLLMTRWEFDPNQDVLIINKKTNVEYTKPLVIASYEYNEYRTLFEALLEHPEFNLDKTFYMKLSDGSPFKYSLVHYLIAIPYDDLLVPSIFRHEAFNPNQNLYDNHGSNIGSLYSYILSSNRFHLFKELIQNKNLSIPDSMLAKSAEYIAQHDVHLLSYLVEKRVELEPYPEHFITVLTDIALNFKDQVVYDLLYTHQDLGCSVLQNIMDRAIDDVENREALFRKCSNNPKLLNILSNYIAILECEEIIALFDTTKAYSDQILIKLAESDCAEKIPSRYGWDIIEKLVSIVCELNHFAVSAKLKIKEIRSYYYNINSVNKGLLEFWDILEHLQESLSSKDPPQSLFDTPKQEIIGVECPLYSIQE